MNKTDSHRPGAAIASPDDDRCPYCSFQAPVVWVHGHGQCGHCGINIDECCRGEQGR